MVPKKQTKETIAYQLYVTVRGGQKIKNDLRTSYVSPLGALAPWHAHVAGVVLSAADVEVGVVGAGANCIKMGLPGKSILGNYFQENRTSRRPFL